MLRALPELILLKHSSSPMRLIPKAHNPIAKFLGAKRVSNLEFLYSRNTVQNILHTDSQRDLGQHPVNKHIDISAANGAKTTKTLMLVLPPKNCGCPTCEKSSGFWALEISELLDCIITLIFQRRRVASGSRVCGQLFGLLPGHRAHLSRFILLYNCNICNLAQSSQKCWGRGSKLCCLSLTNGETKAQKVEFCSRARMDRWKQNSK